jgi:hypothetical protein
VYPQLPPRANLEHLKKEAKTVLRVFRRHAVEWRLADAQRAVARGYGFPSWARLKEQVESVAPAPRSPRRRPGSEIRAAAMDERPRQANLIAGTWTASRGRAIPPGSAANQGAMLSVEIAGDVVTMTHVTFGQPGDESAMRMSIRADGREHRLEPGGVEVLQARWIDSRVLEMVVTRGTEAVGRGQYEVSEAGDLLTVSSTDRVVVFERG